MMTKGILPLLIALCYLAPPVHGAVKKAEVPKAAPVPQYNPAKQPVVTGEFAVGLIVITFKDSAIPMDIAQAIKSVERVNGTNQEADSGAGGKSKNHSSEINLTEYFKTYSNGIAWPKIEVMPDANTCYQDPHFYGYYCEYEFWENPIGWKDRAEGEERVKKMNQNALRFAEKGYRGTKPRFTCYNYITARQTAPTKELTAELLQFYQNRSADPNRTRMVRTRKAKKRAPQTDTFDPWTYYAPVCKWGEPMWPNSKIQIDDFAGGVLAHELGHCLGAPDVYRVGRFNDGIGGTSCLLSYGPTANAFSRFYHHAYIKEHNHPTLKTSGTYTLHPRHITPEGNEAVGYLIPSNHPHYAYQVEYIHGESGSVGVGPGHEGMLISVVNLGLTNYLGSPDYFYVYRPHDPFFLGEGDTNDCLFGKSHQRTKFSMSTEPSSRLPNLLDGGVSFENIEEHGDTLTFDLIIEHHPVTGSAYTNSMLPQIRLDAIHNVQATSFAMDCTIKFRGEPLITTYGFCWSTSALPTVRDATYTLAHRECYQGHAINLTPGTTYHIRAFATNGIGVRYSDEELTVKTPDLKTPPSSIGPLFTDSFSDNKYLFTEFSNETTETSETFIGYSPTCVLAEFIAYYRPVRFVANGRVGAKTPAVDFNQLSWNPGAGDFPMRLEEIDEFFQQIHDQSLALGLHDLHPGKDFLRNIVKLTGVRSKPVLSTLALDNLKQVSELIRQDLLQSRPVILVLSDTGDFGNPVRWALIDGIDTSGKFHVEFPRNSKLYYDKEWHDVKSGYVPSELLILPLYKTLVVTSCFYPK